MYFNRFNSIYYGFQIGNNYVIKPMVDITQNVRVFKNALENISLYDIYDIKDNETPEIIAYRLYGSAELHWTIMIANEMYDYLNDWPMNQFMLQAYTYEKYNRFECTTWSYDANIVTAKIPNHDITINQTEDVTVENMYVIKDGVKQSIPQLQGTIQISAADIEAGTVTLIANGSVTGTPVAGFTLYTNNREFKTIHHYEKDGFVVESSVVGSTPIYCNEYEVAMNDAKRQIKIVSPNIIGLFVSEFNNIMSR